MMALAPSGVRCPERPRARRCELPCGASCELGAPRTPYE